jgi:hypothetical protein
MKLRACLVLAFFSAATARCFCLDRNAFTFTNYNLNVQVEPAQQRIGVRGKIILRNDATVPQKNAVLQISSSLDWRSIQIDGKPVQFVSQPYTSDIDHTGSLSEAIVSLPREIPLKGTIAMEIGYEGTIVLDATRLTRIGVPEDRAPHSDWDQISRVFTAVRGMGYVAWYPVATEAANLSEGESVFETVGRWKQRELGAEMRINLQVNSAPTEAGLISIQNAQSCKDGWPTTTPGSDNECTYSHLDRVVPAFLVGPYSTLRGSSATLAFLNDHKAAAQNWSDAANQVLPVVKEWFGIPQRPVQVVELPDAAAAPFETGRLVVTPLGDDQKFAQTLLVHQLTHAALESDRSWIREGLAHFAQALWREQQNGRSAALDYLGLHRTALADAERNSSASEEGSARSLISTGDEELYRSKAMFVWWMLRDMVGDAPLHKAIAAYRVQDDREPSYVQHLIQGQPQRDLEWFFDDWVYRDRGLPDFRIVSVYPRKMLNGGYLVTVSVENLGAAGAEVPVTARTDSREVSQRLEVRGKATATIRIELPGSPDEVIVNDGSVPESDLNNNSFRVPKPAK